MASYASPYQYFYNEALYYSAVILYVCLRLFAYLL